MRRERWARLTVAVLALLLTVAALVGRWASRGGVEIHARMAEAGGFMPSELTATVGEPLELRITSDDVMHSFAIGGSDREAIDVAPGVTARTTLRFDRPGKYTFYCTRWCGPNHWRMRGTIDVRGPGEPMARTVPRYVALGLDVDAPHPAAVVPARRPSARRGAEVAARTPGLLSGSGLRDVSPVAVWDRLRRTAPATVNDADLWDLVAFAWRSSTTPAALDEGRRLYAANCAACHGETGNGRGVMAERLTVSLDPRADHAHGRTPAKPADFTKAATMLGASSTVLEGKIIRGGMGTGMPYWGPIFTDAQIAALADYLWTFQFDATHPASATPPAHTTAHRH